MMEIANAIKSLYAESECLEIDGFQVLNYSISTPAHQFDVFNIIFDNYFVQIKTRDGYDTNLIKEIISYCKDKNISNLPKDKLTVFKDFKSQCSSFPCLGVTPPSIAHCFKHQSEYLEKIGYWIFPLYDKEFEGGESESDFHFDNGNKGRGIHVIDWNRKKANK